MSKAFLVYKPALSYGDTEFPFLVCLQEETAKRVVKETLEFIGRLKDDIGPEPYLPDEFDEELFAIWNKWDNKSRKLIRSAEWPHGFNVFYFDWDHPDCVAYREIKILDILPKED
jgi:hypothetical protein